MKKTVLFSLAGLCLLAVLVFGTGYALSYRLSSAELPGEAKLLTPEGGAATGDSVRFVFDVKLPLRFSLGTVTAELPEQLVLSGSPEIRPTGYFFTRMRYRVTVSAVVLAAGEVPGGLLRPVTDKPLTWQPQEVRTPAFSAAKAEPIPQPLLADAVEVRGLNRTRFLWMLGAGGLVLLAILGILLLRKRRRVAEKPLTIQELAIREIAELRHSLQEQRQPETVLGRLSNVVRIYLERRFDLPLSRSTTEEFFASSLQREKIPAPQRPFLAEFLRTADMVKFARANAAPEAVQSALDSAENLVRSTSPSEEDAP